MRQTPSTAIADRRNRRARAPFAAALRAAVAGLAVALLLAPPALAGPKGGKASKGKVKIRQNGNKTRIRASHGAVIDWDSFDIGRKEKVKFVQPGKKSRVLNRVDDSAPTRIDGTLRANGQVYIVNSAGIFFGGEAVVDVGRLVAGAGQLRDDDFREGIDRFRRLSGSVANAGTIEADAVALIGRKVTNQGRLTARKGSVAMLAGDAVWLAHPESDVRIRVADASAGAVGGPSVENSGLVEARHGRARLAAGDGLSLALHESSDVQARKIHVEADDVEVAGRLDARDERRGKRGGEILVLGDTVRTVGAEIDASGDAGGGQIRIGGGFQGGEGLRRAHVTGLDDATVVRADALRRGDGGAAIVWSDDYSFVGAEMSARAGERGGDGGLVETSSKKILQVLRAADVSAAEGRAGTWLLDPSNVRIVADPSDTGDDEQSLDDSPGARRPILALFQSDGAPATVTASVIEEALELGTSVLVTTDTFNDVGDDVGNIHVEAPILIDDNIADQGSLLLLAANNLRIEENIEVADSATYALNLFLVANDNELGTISQSVNDLRSQASVQSGGILSAPTIQPELGQTQPAEEGGLDGNRQAELGNLVIDEGVSIDTGGGQIQGQGRNIRLKEGGTIETDGAGIVMIAENPVQADDRVTGGDSGRLIIRKSILTDGGGAGLRARGTTEIGPEDGGAPIELDFTDVNGDGSFVQIDARDMVLDADLTVGEGGLDFGRRGIPGLRDTQTMTVGDDGSVEIRSKGEIRLFGGDLDMNASVNNCRDFDCSDRSVSEDLDIVVSADNLVVDAGNTLDLGSRDEVLIDLDEGLDAQGTLLTDADSRTRVRAGLALQSTRNPDKLDALKGKVNITFAAGQGSILTGDEVALRAGDGRSGRRDEFEPDDARLTAEVTIPDGLIDPATADFKLIQDASFDDTAGQPVPQLDSGATLTLRSADGSLTLQDPTAAGGGGTLDRLDGQDVLLRGGTGATESDPAIVIELGPTGDAPLTPQDLELRVDEDFRVDAPLADELKPAGQLTLHAGFSGSGNLILDGTDAGNTTRLEATEIVLRAGDGPSSLSEDEDGNTKKIDSEILFDGGNVAFSLADPAGTEPLSLTWRQDATIDADSITPIAADPDAGIVGVGFSETLDPLGDGSLDPDGDVVLAFRSDDGSLEIATIADQVSGLNRDLTLIGRTDVQTRPNQNDFVVKRADVGGVDDFVVTQRIVDGFEFTDPDESSLTLRAAYGRGGVLSFDESESEGVRISATEIRLAANADEDGQGGGRIAVYTSDADKQPVFQGAGGEGTNPNVFAMHQRDDLSDVQIPDSGFFGAGRYPMSVALRSDFQPTSSSSAQSILVQDLALLPGMDDADVPGEDRLLVLSGPAVGIAAITPEIDEGDALDEGLENLDFTALEGEVVVEADAVQLLAVREDPRDGGDAPFLDASDNLYLTGFVPENDFAQPVVDGGSGQLELSLAEVFPQLDDTGAATSPESVLLEAEGNFTLAQLPTLDKFGSGSLSDNGQTTGAEDLPLAILYEVASRRAGVDVSDAGLRDRITGANMILNVKSNGAGVSTAIDPDTMQPYARTVTWGTGAYDFEALDASAQQAMLLDGSGIPISITALEQLRLKAGGSGNEGQDLVLTGDVDLSGETIRLIAGNGGSTSTDGPESAPKIIATGAQIDLTFTGEENVSTDDGTRLVFRQDANLTDTDLPDPDQITVDDGELDELRVTSEEGIIELANLGRLDARSAILTSTPGGTPGSSLIRIETDDLSFDALDPDDPDPPEFVLQAETVKLKETDPDAQLILGGTILQLNGSLGAGTRPQVIKLVQEALLSRGDTMVEASQLGAALAGAEVRLRSRSSDVIVGTALADRLILTNLVLAAADSVEVDVDEGLRDYSLDLANLAVFSDEDDDGVGRILLTTEQTDRDSDLEADEYSRASIRTLDRQIYFGDVAVGANVRLKGNEVIFRDTVEAFTSQDVDASLEVKVNNRARFADDVGVVAPLDRLEVILGQPPANALTEAGFAERSDLGDTILVLRKEPDPSGGAGRANPERMTVRTQGNLHLRRKETDVPRTAVIRAEGDELVDQFLFQSDGGNVAFGEQMRMAVDGSLRVESRDPGDPATGDAPGKVKVADLAVAGRLALDAPEVFIRRRDGGRMLQASGAEVLDPGTLIVANDLSIETNNLVLSGEGRDPLFGLPNPLDAPDSLRGADGTLVYPVAAIKRNFEPIDGSDIRLQETDPDRPNFGRLTDTFTMIRPDGPSAADLAPDLNSDLDRLAPDLHQPLPLVVAALDERSLDTIGIALRGTTAAERESRREGAAVYDDVRPVRDPVRVVSTRLMADMTGEAARSYDRLFGRNGENAPRIREILQGALDHYRRETRARRVVGFEFRRYVKNRPSSEFEAHQALLELDRLFRSHRNSGLSREEYREIQASWLASIQPDGITTEELAEAIHPSRYVRGSDILDIFGD